MLKLFFYLGIITLVFEMIACQSDTESSISIAKSNVSAPGEVKFNFPDSLSIFIEREIKEICSENALHECIAVYYNKENNNANYYVNRFYSLNFFNRNPTLLYERKGCTFILFYTGAEDIIKESLGSERLALHISSYLDANPTDVNYDEGIRCFQYNSENGELISAKAVEKHPYLRPLSDYRNIEINPPK